MDKIKIISKKNIEKLPKTAGAYLFYIKPIPNTSSAKVSAKQKFRRASPIPIYIGKAINIKNRVKNHFFQPSYRDNLFIKKVAKIGFIETNSEIEALILESNLIKKHKPKFNVVWKDDKNYFYVAIAQNKQKIPYIYITHQPTKNQKSKIKNQNDNSKSKISFVGPFIEGGSLKKTLKYLRRVFPYYISQKHPKNKCTWCHLDLCPGPPPPLKEGGEASSQSKRQSFEKEYKKNIKKLILILQGKRRKVLNSLRKEMKSLAKERKFEEAGKIRDRLFALEKIMAHIHVIDTTYKIDGRQFCKHDKRYDDHYDDHWRKIEKILKELMGINSSIKRIECYDISNIQGKQATGSMVVFVNGKPDKSQYKRFKIRMEQEPNDIAMIKEVLTRRFNHPDWPYPEVILIDGGIAQLNVTLKAKSYKLKAPKIRVISIAKGKQELFIEGRKNPIPLKNLPQEVYNLIKHLDDEAHRFAISYHKKLRKRAMRLDSNK